MKGKPAFTAFIATLTLSLTLAANTQSLAISPPVLPSVGPTLSPKEVQEQTAYRAIANEIYNGVAAIIREFEVSNDTNECLEGLNAFDQRLQDRIEKSGLSDALKIDLSITLRQQVRDATFRCLPREPKPVLPPIEASLNDGIQASQNLTLVGALASDFVIYPVDQGRVIVKVEAQIDSKKYSGEAKAIVKKQQPLTFKINLPPSVQSDNAQINVSIAGKAVFLPINKISAYENLLKNRSLLKRLLNFVKRKPIITKNALFYVKPGQEQLTEIQDYLNCITNMQEVDRNGDNNNILSEEEYYRLIDKWLAEHVSRECLVFAVRFRLDEIPIPDLPIAPLP